MGGDNILIDHNQTVVITIVHDDIDGFQGLRTPSGIVLMKAIPPRTLKVKAVTS